MRDGIRLDIAGDSGVRQAANDLVEMAQSIRGDTLRALDERLRAQHVPTLTQMRARSGRLLRAILKEKRIRDDDDYYLLKEALGDLTNGVLADRERVLAETLLAHYESSERGGV